MVSLITGIIGIATALVIVFMIRRDHLHVRYGLWWMAAALAFALLGFIPALFDRIAGYLDIAYPPVLALALGLIVLVIKILVMDLERSRNAIKLNRLVQRVALLESGLRDAQGRPAGPDYIESEAEQQDPPG
jgi:hypothetical protein